jgi:putative ABC transport system permease protein
MNRSAFIDTLWRDVKFSLRTMLRRPAATGITLLTIALGIGATTATFSIVNAVLFRPLPYPEPQALVGVWLASAAPGRELDNLALSASMYLTFRDENRTFESFGVWNNGAASVTGLGDPEEVSTLRVTSEILPALRVPPILGRWFSAADDSPEGAETIILTHDYWQRRLGGDPQVVGQTITMDSRPREVIGVMPQEFRFLNLAPAVILPQRFDRSALPPNTSFNYQGLARLKAGVTPDEAGADVARMLPLWVEAFGIDRLIVDNARLGPSLRGLKLDVVGDVGNALWVLMGTVGVVLLIACANVANLLLVKATGRRQELAVRAALGAGRKRIARELLVESVLLGLIGGVLGLGAAQGALRLLVALAPGDLPRLAEVSLDPVVLGFALFVSLSSGLLFGVIPVLKHARAGIAMPLRGGRSGGHTRERQLSQRTLVVVQVALALVVLVGSGLMLRSFAQLASVDPGFTDPEHLQTFRLAIPPGEAAEPERVIRMQNDILDRLAAIPGVTSAAFTSAMPMETAFLAGNGVWIEGQTQPGDIPPLHRAKSASPGLLTTQGTPLIAGRDFTWTDVYEERDVVLVSARMARETWGDPIAALGKNVRLGPTGPWLEVVGVSADVHDEGVDLPVSSTLYRRAGVQRVGERAERATPRAVTFAIRSERAATESFLAEVREAVWSVSQNLPLAQLRTLADVQRGSLARTSFTLAMLGIAGSMALLLGVIGIYGVVSYTVSQRSREVGVRVAVGAQKHDVTALFLREGLLLACLGVVIGLAAAAGLARLMSALLFGVSPLDWTTYAAAAAVLLLACALASYLPARRAATIDPMETLRAE